MEVVRRGWPWVYFEVQPAGFVDVGCEEERSRVTPRSVV